MSEGLTKQTWDCVHPAAILSRLMTGTNVDDSIIIETLECFGYAQNGQVNIEDANRQFEIYKNVKDS